MKAFKMKINGGHGDPTMFKEAQRILFDMGYRWAFSGSEYLGGDAKYVYSDGLGQMFFDTSKPMVPFENLPGVEFELKEVFSYVIEEKRETVEIYGKTYFKDEVVKALSILEQVEET